MPATFSQWIEAEAPSNTLVKGANIITCANTNQYKAGATCTEDSLQEGASCCSEGKIVVNLLGRLDGGEVFNGINVPADGLYDVTWWYHCGASDVFMDTKCGGLHYPVGIGCRPHMIEVNNVLQTAGPKAEYYQFPCYSTPWPVIHATTTTLPLKAGTNTIFIHTPDDYISQSVDNGLDGVDLDAIHIVPAGKGIGLHVTPVAQAN